MVRYVVRDVILVCYVKVDVTNFTINDQQHKEFINKKT